MYAGKLELCIAAPNQPHSERVEYVSGPFRVEPGEIARSAYGRSSWRS